MPVQQHATYELLLHFLAHIHLVHTHVLSLPLLDSHQVAPLAYSKQLLCCRPVQLQSLFHINTLSCKWHQHEIVRLLFQTSVTPADHLQLSQEDLLNKRIQVGTVHHRSLR